MIISNNAIEKNNLCNIRDIQLVQLGILKEVIKICDKHNITYFIVGGTLLGAVRHAGFIPWDDDIDIAMARDDFDKFTVIAEKELNYPFFLQTNKTDPDYFIHIARIQNLQTTCIEKPFSHLKIKFGISMDIYPLDGFIKSKFNIKRYIFLNKLYELCITDWIDNRKCLKKYIKKYIGNIINFFIYGMQPRKFFFDKIESLQRMIPYNSEQQCAAILHDFHIYQKAAFADTSVYSFEGIDVKGPVNADLYLKELYGDYMKLPPQEKRKPHHIHLKLDINKSYLESNVSEIIKNCKIEGE